jgi:hypothetical protein
VRTFSWPKPRTLRWPLTAIESVRTYVRARLTLHSGDHEHIYLERGGVEIEVKTYRANRRGSIRRLADLVQEESGLRRR